MTGKDVFSRFLSEINTYLGFNDATVEDRINIDENLSDAAQGLIDLHPPQVFADLLTHLKTLIDINDENFLSEEYIVEGRAHAIDFQTLNLGQKNRGFAYSDTEFSFFSSKYLFKEGNIVDFSTEEYSQLWIVIQEFIERCYNSQNNRIGLFLECVINLDINRGFFVKKKRVAFLPEKHYSYVYLSYLDKSKFVPIPDVVKYHSTSLNGALTLNNQRVYEQYFDLYDVFNEVTSSIDILSRFLKVYHLLEYLIYRVYLVELTRRTGANKVFVREFIKASENMKDAEKESFKKNFIVIFSPDLPKLKTDLSPFNSQPIIDFLAAKNIVKGFTQNDINIIALTIYGLRCAIVHNKESEYHLSLSNYEEYIAIIPLITQLIKSFEFLVIEKIKVDFAPIKYPHREMNLY